MAMALAAKITEVGRYDGESVDSGSWQDGVERCKISSCLENHAI